MKINEKIEFLKTNYYSEWIKTRTLIANEISKNQPMFCICGKLATGLHETNCKKLHKKLDSEIVKRLSNLLKN